MNLIPAMFKNTRTATNRPPSSADIAAMIEAEEARQRDLLGQLGGLAAEEREAALKDNAAFNAVVDRRTALERAQRQCELRLIALADELKSAQATEARAQVDAALAAGREAQSEATRLIEVYEAQAKTMAGTLRALRAATMRISDANTAAASAGRQGEEIEYAAALAGWTWGARGGVRCVSSLVTLPSAFGVFYSAEHPNGKEDR